MNQRERRLGTKKVWQKVDQKKEQGSHLTGNRGDNISVGGDDKGKGSHGSREFR